MTVDLEWAIAIIATIVAIRNTFKGWKRNDTTDVEKRVEEQTRINVKLDQIISDTKDIKGEMYYMQKDIKGLTERLIIVEESAKQAHHRIDKIDMNERKSNNEK